jgi:hypothetical protein
MAIFAEIEPDTNKVLQIINIPRTAAARNSGPNYINNVLCLTGTWVRSASALQITQIPGLPKNWAVPGYTYNKELNAFIPPKPYPSWILDETDCKWKSPVQPPLIVGDERYTWNEQIKQWVLVDPTQIKVIGIVISNKPPERDILKQVKAKQVIS